MVFLSLRAGRYNQVRGARVTLTVMIAYDVAGTGPVLVLLHSTVCDRRMWDPQWPVLADAGYRVVRCDFRGFGETPVPTGPANDAEDVMAVLGEAGGPGGGAVALVGASYGGKVALEIAARWPGRVSALALICAGMPGHEPTEALRAFWRREEELLEAGDVAGATELNVATFLGPEASQATRERVRLMQRHAFDVQLAAEEDESAEPAQVIVDLGAITAPSLVVSGARDLPDFRLIADRLAGLLPGARRADLPWAGHLPTLERPEEMSAMLTAFLRDTGGSRAGEPDEAPGRQFDPAVDEG
jgi:3-oxoadipate enol-lactonase